MAQSLLCICSVHTSNVAFSSCDYTESNDLTANKRHGKDTEGMYRGLTQGSNRYFQGGAEENNNPNNPSWSRFEAGTPQIQVRMLPLKPARWMCYHTACPLYRVRARKLSLVLYSIRSLHLTKTQNLVLNRSSTSCTP
jgi:hypothetical protein